MSRARAHLEPFEAIAIDDEDVTEHVPAWLDSLTMTYLYRVAETSPVMAAQPHRPRWLVQTTFNSPLWTCAPGWSRSGPG